MDLVEYGQFAGLRHPWEVARIEALRKVLSPHVHEGTRVLDLGCGDGYVSRRLFSGLAAGEVTAVDIHLTDERIRELEGSSRRIRYLNAVPARRRFDLLLVLDVIEHVEDDLAFLHSVVERHLAGGGKVMVTVPTFQALYGHHDVILGHHRRYAMNGLEKVARGARLEIVSSGYLFGTLLLPKLLCNKLWQLGFGSAGVATWHGGRIVTSLVESMLNLDNSLLLAAARRGVRIPGLSAWALCRKPD